MTTGNQNMTPKPEAQASSASLDSVFELRDTTDDEVYHVVGMFQTKEKAMNFLGECDRPWKLCEFAEDYAKLTLQEVPFCVGSKAHGETVWEQAWVYGSDDDGDTWDVYTPND